MNVDLQALVTALIGGLVGGWVGALAAIRASQVSARAPLAEKLHALTRAAAKLRAALRKMPRGWMGGKEMGSATPQLLLEARRAAVRTKNPTRG